MFKAALLLGVAAMAVGCDRSPSRAELAVEDRKQSEDMQARIKRPLEPRVLAAGAHQVHVVDIPSADFGVLVSMQRCYVWRDSEFKTSSMSCPSHDHTLDTQR